MRTGSSFPIFKTTTPLTSFSVALLSRELFSVLWIQVPAETSLTDFGLAPEIATPSKQLEAIQILIVPKLLNGRFSVLSSLNISADRVNQSLFLKHRPLSLQYFTLSFVSPLSIFL